jgi:hypothetical protein
LTVSGLVRAPPVLSLCCAGRQIVAIMRHRRTEDRLSMTRRHVAEGEDCVARQEILIAELDPGYDHPER